MGLKVVQQVSGTFRQRSGRWTVAQSGSKGWGDYDREFSAVPGPVTGAGLVVIHRLGSDIHVMPPAARQVVWHMNSLMAPIRLASF